MFKTAMKRKYDFIRDLFLGYFDKKGKKVIASPHKTANNNKKTDFNIKVMVIVMMKASWLQRV